MRILSRKKPNEKYLSEIVGRCPNEEYQALLMLNENDVFAEYYRYDEEDHEDVYEYFFECLVCKCITKLYWLRSGILNDVSRELIKRRCDRNLKLMWTGGLSFKKC